MSVDPTVLAALPTGDDAPQPDRTLCYGPHPDQVIDLRRPPGRPRALLVLLHGGFWRPAIDRAHAAPLAAALAAAGYLVAVPEYRRAGFPEIFDDIAAAIDLLATGAGEPAQPEWAGLPVVLVGHSAGGHFALWTAARPHLPADSPWHTDRTPDAVLALAACSCLTECDAWKLGEDATTAMMGGRAAELPGRYALADPAQLLPLTVPTTLLHGAADERVPVELSRIFAERARAAGPAPTLVELPGAGHFTLIDPHTPAWPALLAALDGLREQLG
ncbi:alpha/beta hydrolase [Kitasatospora sp. NBC_01302]|uniref:alpha/beta hydrolase n=1 Tax=Kitasatospora sp. NBC_01302 TaxID=2903575 RepID=UPI002E11145B|nr:alpha/beta hydrolase [Kitasatospora sp. NBC_01302]